MITAEEKKLLDLLTQDARQSTVALARKLGISRPTVVDRIQRLEAKKIITGYTVRLNPEFNRARVSAHTLLRVDPKKADAIGRELRKIQNVAGFYALSGEFDLLAILHAGTTTELDGALDLVGRIDGVERTQTSILLAVKFER